MTRNLCSFDGFLGGFSARDRGGWVDSERRYNVRLAGVFIEMLVMVLNGF